MSSTTRQVTLRDTRDESGRRLLTARLTDAGDVIIEGQDLGGGVAGHFGAERREYEWAWTIRAAQVHGLRERLGGGPGADVLELLVARFSGDAAAGLLAFLEESQLPYETWSRVGD